MSPVRPRAILRAAALTLGLAGAVTGATAEPQGGAEVAMPVRFDAVLALPSREPDYRASYGAAPSQNAALWLPADTTPAPLVVLLHGGCWLVDYSAGHIYPLATRLAEDGFAVWVPEYRRVGEPGGGWPGTAEDLLAALQALSALENPALERGNVVYAGHSAGGHLALWLAAQEAAALPAGLAPRAVLGLAPIADLHAYARGSNSCETVTPRFMGGTPEALPDAYAAASPATLPSRVATLLLRGSADPIVPGEQLDALGTRALVTRSELDGAGHFDWIHPQTAAYGELLEALRRVTGYYDAPGKP